MKPYTMRVVEIIKAIPEGHVMTYGQIAEMAGSRRGARQVVRILHSLSAAHGLPWHRVINSKGEVAIRDDEARYMQILYLQNEGVAVDDQGMVDLEQNQFFPSI
ncbi:MGMT family protein [Paenibacillus thalictri]|uniref:DNA methyltransferase n=1 Tax=Paenibacillus thalictri TaxID=2527873 RepID=A0A4Q9DYR0_9BACL|nr:MGMT family protein [Paenibacillus thalictri]TBL81028.1 DNA methyltransferase [Paenibacillus thalictri]